MSKHGARFQMLPREYMMDLEVGATAASGAKATTLAESLAQAQISLDLLLAREMGIYSRCRCQTPDAAVFTQTGRGREGARGRSVQHLWHSEEVLRESHLDDPQEPHGEAALAHATEACAAPMAATRVDTGTSSRTRLWLSATQALCRISTGRSKDRSWLVSAPCAQTMAQSLRHT